MRVDHLLSDSARRYGDLPAIIAGRYRHSYEDLDAKSGRLAAAMAERGIGAGDRIAAYLGAGPAAVVAAFAVFKAGAVLCPVEGRLDADGLGAWLRATGAVGIVTEARFALTAAGAIHAVPDVRLVVLSGADRTTAGGDCICLEEATAGIGPAALARQGTPDDAAVSLRVIGPDGGVGVETLTHGELIAAAAAAHLRTEAVVPAPLSIATHGALYHLVNAVAGGLTQVVEQAATRLGTSPRAPAPAAFRLAG